ncbi:DUF5131 family protein [Carboxydothermus hydrogenoformans]|uniref:Uncharacterized protein n=1 Tax=Carboxydothermus hydrogenoformans (strain ATCC BAA-161 / DSM 6008 / Z-2901) TaxID=246194 RepID=Q3ABH6_CARHZ|nr:phage Gp37/Gp68 family protein [Carboxydothermus hydrogenoformans]ABB14146.1 conserved hypothetical protein [Carboxydothermus hydrogenoformans Z-2901]
MRRTNIEWADAVWNPITGCTPVSEGCQNCYAKRMAYRLRGRCGYPQDEPFMVTLHEDRLLEPYRWRKPLRVFVCSMSDLFHPDVPDEFIFRVLLTVKQNPQHIFMILTKRPERMQDFFKRCIHGTIKNLWLGVTVENQKMANKRIPILLQIPATVRFVSCEPLLDPVDLSKWLGICEGCGMPATKCGPVLWRKGQKCCPECTHDFYLNWSLNWVIVGGETGPKRRPANIQWIRSLRDQCVAAGVPFFLKQMEISGRIVKMPELDGKIWNEYPSA